MTKNVQEDSADGMEMTAREIILHESEYSSKVYNLNLRFWEF